MKISRLIMYAGLILLGGLTIFSVYGAFLGAERAARFFNSVPMTVFWCVLTVIFVGGFLFYRRLWSRPFLLMIHAGCLLVLAGGLWGSQKGLALQNQYFQTNLFYKGILPLYQGQSSKILYDHQGNPMGDLPFEIRLDKFEIEYYDKPQFVIRDKAHPQQLHTLPVAGDKIQSFGHEGQEIQFSIIRSFANLQIRIEEGKPVAAEGDSGFDNPGYEVQFLLPDGSEERQYVFERFPMHSMPKYRFEIEFHPPQMPSEYTSDLAVIADGQIQKQQSIEVNHPLFYKGFLFHQKNWGQNQQGAYSVIGVVTNSGLGAVFGGYALLAAGIVGQLWIIPATMKTRKKGQAQ